MRIFIKNNKIFIILMVILAFISVFGKSIYEEKQLEIKELKTTISKYELKIDSNHKSRIIEMVKYNKLERELSELRESKDIEIAEGINADGSSFKTTKIKTKKKVSSVKSSSVSNDSMKDSNKSSEKELNLSKEDKSVELKNIKNKTIKKVDSGLKPLLYIGGGIVLCVLSGICGVL